VPVLHPVPALVQRRGDPQRRGRECCV